MTLLTLDPGLSLPYAQNWNLNIQRAFGGKLLFEIGFVGTNGTKLPRFIEGNPTIYIPGQSTEDNVNQRRLYSGCTLTQPDNSLYSENLLTNYLLLKITMATIQADGQIGWWCSITTSIK